MRESSFLWNLTNYMNVEAVCLVVVAKLQASRAQQNRATLQEEQRSPGVWRQLATRSEAKLATLCCWIRAARWGEWSPSVTLKHAVWWRLLYFNTHPNRTTLWCGWRFCSVLSYCLGSGVTCQCLAFWTIVDHPADNLDYPHGSPVIRVPRFETHWFIASTNVLVAVLCRDPFSSYRDIPNERGYKQTF
jgi:hypothetical protein